MKKIRMMLSFFIATILLYSTLFLFFPSIETRLTFPKYGFPFEKPNVPPGIKEIILSVPSSQGPLTLYGWYFPHPNATHTIYYFHGNGGTLWDFFHEIIFLYNLGYHVMAYDYPGYGLSTGIPTEDTVLLFSKTFYHHMVTQYNIKKDTIILWGFSIGSAVATQFLKHVPHESIVLIAPFSSRQDMATQYFGFPLHKLFFQKNSFTTKETLTSFTGNILIVHGTNDRIIAYHQGKAIFDALTTPQAHFITVKHAGHNNIISSYGNILTPYFLDFLQKKPLPREIYLPSHSSSKKEETNGKEHCSPPPWKLPGSAPKRETQTQSKLLIDISSDSSVTKYVGPTTPFHNPSYVPHDLEIIDHPAIRTYKQERLRKEALQALVTMANDFYKEFGTPLVVISAFRDFEYQKFLVRAKCTKNFCAKEGHSEHQTGLALDLFEASTKEQFLKKYKTYYTWLARNAHKYGFHNSYQKGVAIDGYEEEPWHWRYLGREVATMLHQNNQTFTQYILSYK